MFETYVVSLGVAVRADLGGRREVLKNLPPSGIFGGTAAMALVDHDEIEEARRKLAEHLLVFLRPGDRLIETEIDFISGVDAPRAPDAAGQRPGRAGRAVNGPRPASRASSSPRRTAGSR